MKRIIISLILAEMSIPGLCGLPQVASGRIVRYEQFPSKYIASRNVDVWLPDGYPEGKPYAVLYMHDGQMLFDSSGTWNKQAWDAGDAASRLMKEGKIRNLIIVGVWNSGPSRHMDYFPQKPFESMPAKVRDSILNLNRDNGVALFQNPEVRSDNYLRFLARELKPFIDSAYATDPSRQATCIAGSSMGGLISLYAICEYPEVFGGAACISTHWPGIFTLENNPIPETFLNYLAFHLPDPATHRIWFDHGTATLDALYPALQQQVDLLMKKRGYTRKNWITREFPGEDHSERAWRKRFEIPLVFLLRR